MSRATATAVLGLVFAACVGAAFVGAARQKPSPAGANGGSSGATAPQGGVESQDPVDQRAVVDLPVVRAPEDVGERALTHVRNVVEFGARHSGATPTPGWSQQIEYITKELRAAGVEVEHDTWTERKERITFTNIIATIPGSREERIVLACHHDTKCTQGHREPERNFHFVGANDGGSGVGLLLALAPVLRQRQNLATIQIVFFDGEESLDWSWNNAARALFGSRRFVRKHRDDAAVLGKAPRIEAMVLLDMVGRTDLHIQEELYSTTELRKLLWSAAVATGNRDVFFRDAEAASDDHVPFLEVGIPAIDLIDLRGNPHWHQKTDTVENMSAASLQRVADVVLTMLPAIEAHYVGRH